MKQHKKQLVVLLLVLTAFGARGQELVDPYEDTAEFLADQEAGEEKAANTIRAYQYKLIRPNGTTKILATRNVNTLLKPASTLKLFTGWWAFEAKNRTNSYLGQMLKTSSNSMAQSTLVRLGGAEAMENYFRNLGLTVNNSTLRVADGSGLSYANQSNCAVQIELLEMIHRDGDYATFRDLLAQPGQAGTLEKRLKSLKGKVFAKTGTLKKTAALSGFIEAPQGVIVFCAISDYLTGTVASERNRLDQQVIQNYNRAK